MNGKILVGPIKVILSAQAGNWCKGSDQRVRVLLLPYRSAALLPHCKNLPLHLQSAGDGKHSRLSQIYQQDSQGHFLAVELLETSRQTTSCLFSLFSSFVSSFCCDNSTRNQSQSVAVEIHGYLLSHILCRQRRIYTLRKTTKYDQQDSRQHGSRKVEKVRRSRQHVDER